MVSLTSFLVLCSISLLGFDFLLCGSLSSLIMIQILFHSICCVVFPHFINPVKHKQELGNFSISFLVFFIIP